VSAMVVAFAFALLLLATTTASLPTIFFANGLIIINNVNVNHNHNQQVSHRLLHQPFRLSRWKNPSSPTSTSSLSPSSLSPSPSPSTTSTKTATSTALMIASSSSSSSSMSGDHYYDDDNDNDNDEMMRQQSRDEEKEDIHSISRRSMMAMTAMTSVLLTTPTTAAYAASKNNGLVLNKDSSSGLRWADAKVGTGTDTPRPGIRVSIDYSMASTAGRFPSIYTTKDKGEPYTWILGDGTTIKGIEIAIQGSSATKDHDGGGDNNNFIPPMKAGGIRRIIIPNTLGYNDLISNKNGNNLSPASNNKRCIAGNEGSIGPIPPKDAPDGAYQRWYQFYCNPRIPYQPDLVLDIKLYGKR
jgi:FKBP-type peptidyl-prolyl cis-trans isomerase